jgi:hypothetical protein
MNSGKVPVPGYPYFPTSCKFSLLLQHHTPAHPVCLDGQFFIALHSHADCSAVLDAEVLADAAACGARTIGQGSSADQTDALSSSFLFKTSLSACK